MPENKLILLCGDPVDPLMQLLAEDLAVVDDNVEINAPFDRDRHDRVIFLDQAAFIAGLLFLKLGETPVTVILRREGLRIRADNWETGVATVGRIVAAKASDSLRVVALSAEAVDICTKACGIEVDLFQFPSAPLGALDAESDHRIPASIDAETGHIVTDRGRMELDGQNWVQLRQRLRIEPDAALTGDQRDIVEICNLRFRAPNRPAQPVYVCVVTNGVGLGHLTRLLAIGDALREKSGAKVVYWCFSQGAAIIEAAGYEVIQRATAKHLDCDYDDWIRWETSAFSAMLKEFKPAGVIYDASGVDPFVIKALQQPGNGGVSLVQVRRAMWKPQLGSEPLDSAQHCALVLEPGDLAQSVDRGATVTAKPRLGGFAAMHRTAPVVLREGNEPLARRDARRALGIPLHWRRVCLISLGGDALGRDATLARNIEASARRANVRLIWARSPLARSGVGVGRDPDAVRHLYPLGRYLPGFDGLITACGYNSYHEALQTQLPVLFVPKLSSQLDDQFARAAYANAQGWAELYDTSDPGAQTDLLDRFMAQVRQRTPQKRPQAPSTGAEEMASAILSETWGTAE